MTTGFQTSTQFAYVQEKFKGTFDTLGTTYKGRQTFYLGQHSWAERCKKFNQDYERHSLAKQAMISLGGQIIAEGLYLQPVTRVIDDKEQAYPRSEEAVKKCEDLNERIDIKNLLFETGKQMGKYGSHFWEKTLTPEFNVRAIPFQEVIEPAAQDGLGNVVEWRQVIMGQTKAKWISEEVVANHWDVTTQSWPYGTSLLVGLDTEFETLEDLETNASEYMKKQAWPYEVFQIGNGVYQPTPDDFTNVQSKLKAARPGETLVTDIPSQILTGGGGGAPIRELSAILDFMKANLQDGLILPSLSKLYNSTEASAKVVVGWAISSLVKPMQEILRVNLREQVYKPYLVDLGFSPKDTPSIFFEPPDAQKKNEMEFWKGMVEAGICPPVVAAREFGWEDEFKEWQEEKQREQEQMMQKQAQQQDNQGEDKKGDVWEVRKKPLA